MLDRKGFIKTSLLGAATAIMPVLGGPKAGDEEDIEEVMERYRCGAKASDFKLKEAIFAYDLSPPEEIYVKWHRVVPIAGEYLEEALVRAELKRFSLAERDFGNWLGCFTALCGIKQV